MEPWKGRKKHKEGRGEKSKKQFFPSSQKFQVFKIEQLVLKIMLFLNYAFKIQVLDIAEIPFICFLIHYLLEVTFASFSLQSQ